MSIVIRAFATGTLVALVACSGGGGGSPQSAPPLANEFATGKLVLTIPASRAAAARRPQFLSPSAASVSISVTGISAPVVADVSATSPDCTTTGGTRTCSIAVSAPVGSDTFSATLYAGANATGAILGIGSTVQQIGSGSPFSLSVGVLGVAASVALSAKQKQFTEGVAATTTLTLVALDAGGNTISGTYQSPIAISNSDTTGTFTVSPASVTSSTTTITLAYSGGTGAKSATISAGGANLPASTLSTQTVTVAPPAPFTLAPASVSLLAKDITATVHIVDPSAYSGTYTCVVAKPSVATASSAGKTITVTSIGAGTTTLTVTASDGRTATLPITVTTTTLPVQ